MTIEERNAYHRRWHEENKERVNAQRRAWYKKTNDERREKRREYLRQNPEKVRAWHLKKAYGLTLEVYEKMLGAQRRKCAICGEKLNSPCVDHSHETGEVRELLCQLCNVILGASREKKKILRAAIAYLDKHKPKTENRKKKQNES